MPARVFGDQLEQRLAAFVHVCALAAWVAFAVVPGVRLVERSFQNAAPDAEPGGRSVRA